MTLEEREELIYRQYQEIVAPFIVELEVRDKEYPIEIFNEIRSIFTHLSRYKIQGSESDVMSAENHTKRAILDCFKYLCISIAERIDMFRQDYRKVDLKLANNGEFLPKLDKLEDKARKAYVTAKKAEIEKKGDSELYELYELAYNAYSELDKFLDDSQEAILFASTHSKKSEVINIVSCTITIISIIITIIACVV